MSCISNSLTLTSIPPHLSFHHQSVAEGEFYTPRTWTPSKPAGHPNHDQLWAMAGGSRVSHAKTRNACGRCKQRRVRCNGQGPICNHCHRRAEYCDYQDKSHQSSTSVPLGRSVPPPIVGSLVRHPVPATLGVPGTALCLFESELPLWNTMLPHELTNHVFLRHMMASLDALTHDAKQRSYFHQVESSRQFRRVVPIVTETNWLASMIFGIGLVSFHFQTARITQPQSNNPDPFKALLVLRYSAPLAKAIGPWFMNSMLPSMIRRNNEASLPLDERDDMAILNLHTLLDGDILSLSTNAHAVCEHAIHALYQWLFVTSGRPRTWRDFIEWPAAISDEFLVLAQQQKHPAAVIILIHWCAVMSNAPMTWFMDGWAVAAALQAMSWLDESWRQSPGMVWAREKLMI